MTSWFIVAGAVALLMAYASGRVSRMPLSASVVYLGIGYALGPGVSGFLDVDPRKHSHTIQAITEIVIVISIFSSALKLRVPAFDRRWLDPLRLAFLSMIIGILGIMGFAHYALGIPAGAALLLGAILAPTDPVLASDVQVEHPFEFNRVRFALTGEAGMNDGSALPIVTLGLALVGAGPLWPLWRWIGVDVVWGLLGALTIGGLLGHYGARYMLHLRLAHGEKLGTDNFLALGLIGLSFGIAEAAHAIGFVAVFAAGAAVRGIERRMNEQPPETIEVTVGDPAADQEVATDPERAPVFMLLRLQSFTGNLERIGEAVVVILLGSLVRGSMLAGETLLFAPLLFCVIRPASVLLSLAGSSMSWAERGIAGWFGIRGMASVYYVAYVYAKGAPEALVHRLAGIALGVVTYSILAHGISVTPAMRWFETSENRTAE